MGVTKPTQPTDFYVAGGTLRADAPSYIPRQADEDLYSALPRVHPCGTVRENRENRFRVRYGVDPLAMTEVVSCTEDGMCNSARPHGSVLFTSPTRGFRPHDEHSLRPRRAIALEDSAVLWRERRIAAAPDGARFARKTFSSIQQYGAESGEPVGEPVGCGTSCPAIQCSPDGDLLAIANGSQIRLVRVNGARVPRALDIGGPTADLAFDRRRVYRRGGGIRSALRGLSHRLRSPPSGIPPSVRRAYCCGCPWRDAGHGDERQRHTRLKYRNRPADRGRHPTVRGYLRCRVPAIEQATGDG